MTAAPPRPTDREPPPGDPSAAEIAELRRARAAAESASEAKSRYLVAVSHEIRSPLNAIYGYAQLLERGDLVTGAEAGAMIRRSVDHLTNLAESLLEISRIESGVLTVRSDLIDVRALLDQVAAMFRAEALVKGLFLTTTIAPGLPAWVKSDARRLRQILINLVSNAVKYTETGGVEIVLAYRSQVATIDVIDTGIGIDQAEIERVFEPFERGSASAVQAKPGIGLGLAITRVLTEVLGGELRATSTAGSGSRFRLRLMLPPPFADEVPVDAPALAIQGYAGARRTVLIVEDDPAQCAATRSLLRSLDFTVLCAATGLEGIELARLHAPDLVLLDVQMPGLSGWETARRLRAAHGSSLRIVMVSASAADLGLAEGADGPHDAFLAKPVDFDLLLRTIEPLLDLEWSDGPPAPPPPPAIQTLPDAARPHLQRIRSYAEIGHVLGVEQALAEMDRDVPDAAFFTAMLREHADAFDFAAMLERIDDAARR